jgi:hypothetical protein
MGAVVVAVVDRFVVDGDVVGRDVPGRGVVVVVGAVVVVVL